LPAPYGTRFDTPVIETASLGAAGLVVAVALAIYMVSLIITSMLEQETGKTKV
jgi:hypothetical protein